MHIICNWSRCFCTRSDFARCAVHEDMNKAVISKVDIFLGAIVYHSTQIPMCNSYCKDSKFLSSTLPIFCSRIFVLIYISILEPREPLCNFIFQSRPNLDLLIKLYECFWNLDLISSIKTRHSLFSNGPRNMMGNQKNKVLLRQPPSLAISN